MLQKNTYSQKEVNHMEIELKQIPVRDVVNGYADSAENGVVGYGGKLNIRPAYQREFVYKEKQRDAVINTIVHKFPLFR